MNRSKQVTQRIIVGAVIVHENKFLIIQRSENEKVYPGMWELPSGKRKLLESSKDAVIREVKEETGLSIEIVTPVSVFEYCIEDLKEIRDSTQINFLVRPKNKIDVSLSKEHQASLWIERADLVKYDLSDSTRDTIKRASWLNDLLNS